jgi:rhodanese-related sulfurtransferase
MKSLFGKHAVTFAVVFLVAGAAVAGLSLRGEPQRRLHFGVSQTARTVKPTELASWIIEGRRDFAVIDLRGQPRFDQGHVRDAVSCGTCHTSAEEGRKAVQETMFVDLSKKLVLYTETGTEDVSLPKLLAKNPRLYTLAGGYAAWQRDVLAPVAFGGETDAEQVQEKQRREAVRAFFAGERATSAPAALPLAPIKRKAAHQPAGAREGC